MVTMWVKNRTDAELMAFAGSFDSEFICLMFECIGKSGEDIAAFLLGVGQ